MIARRQNCLGLLLLALAGCPGPAGGPMATGRPPLVERGDGAVVMTASGMAFPKSVAGYDRADPHVYAADGTDVSVGYVRTGLVAGVSATVYVYPAPAVASFGSPPDVVAAARARLSRGEFDRRKAELVDAHPDARLLDEGPVTLAQAGRPHDGWRATYTYGMDYHGSPVTLRSYLYTFCYVDPAGRWAMEYRLDYPTLVDNAALVEQLLHELPWTFRSGD